MPEAPVNPNRATALQATIDEIATRLVVEGIDENVPAALRQLSQTAHQSGYGETAAEAATLADACDELSPDAEAAMQAGLARLLEVLEAENRKASRAAFSMATPPPLASNSLAQDPELVNDFVTESREHLTSVETQMLVLERNPEAKDAIHAVFRGFHTIKGLAGFLEFAEIQKVAHEVETLLDLARNGKVAVSPRLVDVVLEATDYLKASLANVESQLAGQPGQTLPAIEPLVIRIQRAAAGEPEPAAARNEPAPAPEPPRISGQKPETLQPAPPAEMPATMASPAPVPATTAPAPVAQASAKEAGEAAKSAEAFSVRVETTKLDHLMDAVGELVIAQSIIKHSLDGAVKGNTGLSANLAQLGRITADVQRTAMGMRMVAIGQLFQRSNRLVRDLARKLGKNITFEVIGENTEVDKTIAEELADPLMHMVRNAVDHGVEMPQERLAAGKRATARVRLSAYHKGAQIVIEISDDGKGLDRQRILAKAVEKGLITDGSAMSDSEVFALIFEPGFSTAAQVTDLSGRGVGMDVVRRNLAKLRGHIDIESTAGQGSTFYLRLPLTLAIIEGLVVVVGEQRFIVPVFAVREMVRVTPEMLSTFRGQHEMALIRGQLLPIVRLSHKLGITSRSQNLCDGLLVIAESEGKQFGIWIDDLLGRQEVVIKSLGDGLKEIPGVSGCAILGDGRVGLILDVASICRGE